MKLLKIILFLFPISVFSQNTQNIKVNLIDIQTKLPVAGANVSVSKYTLKTQTDSNGVARFNNVPLGRFELEVSSVGYGKNVYKELLLENSRQLVLNLELGAVSKELDEVHVTNTNPRNSALMSVESITNEQVMRFPATFFDPARLAMTFSGVANTNDQANNISVRGNAPEFVQWRLEGVEIVNPNHLSNAGMFSDKPAAVGGGTNILSAQMLGSMDFLSGAFPAGYGNSLSGVFDMNLRNGNNEKYQHVIQVGLLGIDLSSEGPLNKRKGSSYLFNYRYSFTGLLNQAGVNFGGEAISFQDLAFTFNFPTKKMGTFTLFGMGGTSKNIFAPDADSTKWESSKDLTNVDFYGRMGLIGAKHNIRIFKKWNLHSVLVNSALENLRNAYKGNFNINYDYNAKNFLSFNTAISGNINELWALKIGLGLTHQFVRFNIMNSGTGFYNISNLILQPYARITNRTKARFNYNVGFVSPFYSFSNSQYFEPRLAANYYVSPKQQIKAAYGLHSQVVTTRAAYDIPYRPSRAHHFNLGYQLDVDNKQSFSTEVFYQNSFNLAKFDSMYVSTLNGYDVDSYLDGYYMFNQRNQGRNFGVELNYKRYLDKGFFALVNATFYKSQFKAFDGKFYDSRYSGDYIYNVTLGKEWEKSNGKIMGLNTRINWIGGFRDYKIDVYQYNQSTYAAYDFSRPLVVKYDDYFRVDLRAYIKKTKKRGSETISLDLQNLTNRENVAYNYFDVLLNKVMVKKQLGLIPMLNYRWEF